jgi:hypothetical protein
VNSGERDPRYSFHLSLAYEKLGLVDERARSESAQSSGLQDTYLSQMEHEQLRALDNNHALI